MRRKRHACDAKTEQELISCDVSTNQSGHFQPALICNIRKKNITLETAILKPYVNHESICHESYNKNFEGIRMVHHSKELLECSIIHNFFSRNWNPDYIYYEFTSDPKLNLHSWELLTESFSVSTTYLYHMHRQLFTTQGLSTYNMKTFNWWTFQIVMLLK